MLRNNPELILTRFLTGHDISHVSSSLPRYSNGGESRKTVKRHLIVVAIKSSHDAFVLFLPAIARFTNLLL